MILETDAYGAARGWRVAPAVTGGERWRIRSNLCHGRSRSASSWPSSWSSSSTRSAH